MRDLIRALSELETRLEETYGITLNEAMVLCAVGKEIVSAGDVTSRTGMTSSHASKTIRSVEDKGLLSRQLGKQDSWRRCSPCGRPRNKKWRCFA